MTNLKYYYLTYPEDEVKSGLDKNLQSLSADLKPAPVSLIDNHLDKLMVTGRR